MPVSRFDSAPINGLQLDSQTGFLKATNVPIARVGVFPYRKSDGQIAMEAKLPQELLADGTVSSADEKPITNDHPLELVTRDNVSKYMKGFTASNAHVENNNLKVDMTIFDNDLINAIQNGKQELSIGFQTDVIPKPGTFQGTAYDAIQKNIQINHVAVVDRGRAGHSVRITGDSAMMDTSTQGGNSMDTTKVMLDGANVTVLTEDADKVSKANASKTSLQAQLKEAQSKVTDLQAQIDKLNGAASDSNKAAADTKKKADAAQAKADAADSKVADLQKKLDEFKGDSVDKMVQDRLDLIGAAKPYLGDDYDFKGKDVKQIKIDSIKALDDSFDEKDKSDDYVNAYFDSLKTRKPSETVGYTATHNDGQASTTNDLLKQRYHLASAK